MISNIFIIVNIMVSIYIIKPQANKRPLKLNITYRSIYNR
jgi:hypothetical protein